MASTASNGNGNGSREVDVDEVALDALGDEDGSAAVDSAEAALPFLLKGNEVGVVLCHGWRDTPQVVQQLGQQLHERTGCSVFAPLLAGHGTTVEDLAQARAEHWVDDIGRAVNRLHDGGCTRLVVAGIGLGGTLALHAAATMSDFIAGVVSINAAVAFNNPEWAAICYNPSQSQFIPPPEEGPLHRDIKRCYAGDAVADLFYEAVPVASLRELYAISAVTRDLLPCVTCPALVMHSREDHVVPYSNAATVLSGISSVQRTLHTLEHSYHVATLDYDAENIAEAAAAFISQFTSGELLTPRRSTTTPLKGSGGGSGGSSPAISHLRTVYDPNRKIVSTRVDYKELLREQQEEHEALDELFHQHEEEMRIKGLR